MGGYHIYIYVYIYFFQCEKTQRWSSLYFTFICIFTCICVVHVLLVLFLSVYVSLCRWIYCAFTLVVVDKCCNRVLLYWYSRLISYECVVMLCCAYHTLGRKTAFCFLF